MSKDKKTRKEYVSAWTSHIGQLSRIWPNSTDDGQRIIEIKDELNAIIEREAEWLDQDGFFAPEKTRSCKSCAPRYSLDDLEEMPSHQRDFHNLFDHNCTTCGEPAFYEVKT
jgi:hypothetical protein